MVTLCVSAINRVCVCVCVCVNHCLPKLESELQLELLGKSLLLFIGDLDRSLARALLPVGACHTY